METGSGVWPTPKFDVKLLATKQKKNKIKFPADYRLAFYFGNSFKRNGQIESNKFRLGQRHSPKIMAFVRCHPKCSITVMAHFNICLVAHIRPLNQPPTDSICPAYLPQVCPSILWLKANQME
jgi:hypothetical protein